RRRRARIRGRVVARLRVGRAHLRQWRAPVPRRVARRARRGRRAHRCHRSGHRERAARGEPRRGPGPARVRRRVVARGVPVAVRVGCEGAAGARRGGTRRPPRRSPSARMARRRRRRLPHRRRRPGQRRPRRGRRRRRHHVHLVVDRRALPRGRGRAPRPSRRRVHRPRHRGHGARTRLARRRRGGGALTRRPRRPLPGRVTLARRRLAAALAAVVLTACTTPGHASSAPSTTTATTTPGSATVTSSTPTTAPPPADNGLVTIQPGVLTVGTESVTAPWYTATDSSDPTTINGGFEYDLARSIAARLGLSSVRIVVTPLVDVLSAQACACDVMFDEILVTDNRARRADFTEPYLTVDQGVLVRKGTTLST